jgi:hypothetical protein
MSLEGITGTMSGTLYNTVSKKGLGCVVGKGEVRGLGSVMEGVGGVMGVEMVWGREK